MRMARNWAIAIGINQYKNLPSLKYAVRDAELMRDWFVDETHFEKVYLFTDNSLAIDDGKRPYESQQQYLGARQHLQFCRFSSCERVRQDSIALLLFYLAARGVELNLYLWVCQNYRAINNDIS